MTKKVLKFFAAFLLSANFLLLFPFPVSAETITLHPIADTHVRADQPDTNFGKDTKVEIDGDPIQIGFLKFDTASLSGQTISSALLRLWITNNSGHTQNLKDVSTTSWTETGLTYTNRPPLGDTIASFTGTTINTWKELSVTESLKQAQGNFYSLALDMTGYDGLWFSSRDSASNKPELVVSYTTLSPTPTPQPVINVLDFGANGDGVTLNDDAFKKALASKTGPKTLFVPKGNYLFKKGVTLGNDVALSGEGLETVLTASPGANMDVVRNADTLNGNMNITVQNLMLVGNKQTATSGNALVFQKVDGGLIKNVKAIDGTQASIVIRKSQHILVEDTIAEGAGNDNIHIWDFSENVTLSRVLVLKSRGSIPTAISAGFEIADDARNITLLDCESYDNKHDGITIHNHNASQVGADRYGPFDLTIKRFTSSLDKRYGINILAQGPNGPAGILLDTVTINSPGVKGINIQGAYGYPAPTDVTQTNVVVNP